MKKDLFDFSDFDDNIVNSIADNYPDMNKSQQKAICRKTRKRLNISDDSVVGDVVSGIEPARKRSGWYIFGTVAAAVFAVALIPAAFKALKNAPDGPENIQGPPAVDMATSPTDNGDKSAAVTTKNGESDIIAEVTTSVNNTEVPAPTQPTTAETEDKGETNGTVPPLPPVTEGKKTTSKTLRTTVPQVPPAPTSAPAVSTPVTTTKPVTVPPAPPAISEDDIFDILANLSYRQETCDGIADYILHADDGTTYQILTGCNHVWRNGSEEADLTPEIHEWIKKYGSSHKIDNADIVASGEYGAEGANVVWTLDSKGKLTFSGKGAMKDFVAVDGDEPIPMWHGNDDIKEIVIEDGITRIGDFAFDYCTEVESITIPNSVTSIGDFAFNNCSKLESITIPDSVISIDAMAFALCSELKTITIPDSVTTLGEDAFFYCTNLTSVKLSKNLKSIESATFFFCESLESVEIGNKVKSIENNAFACCFELTDITLPESIDYIGDGAFFRCESLETITIKNPDCKFFDSNSVICNDYDSVTETVTADFTIIGKAGSTAEEHAKKNNIAFEKAENQTIEHFFATQTVTVH